MSNAPVFSRLELERTIQERIRQRTVALGYLPDLMAYLPETLITRAAYEAARVAVITSGKQLIDVDGIGNVEARGEKTVNKFYINLRTTNAGSIAHNAEYYTQTSPTTWEKKLVRGSTKNLLIDIRTVCRETAYDRICSEILWAALTSSDVGKALAAVKPDHTFDNTKTFLIRSLSNNEIKGGNFFERLHTFELIDVWLENFDEDVVNANIPSLTNIQGHLTLEPPPTNGGLGEVIINIP
jgi:hypothetical protein